MKATIRSFQERNREDSRLVYQVMAAPVRLSWKKCINNFSSFVYAPIFLHYIFKWFLGQVGVAPCGACRPWIFFINGVLCSWSLMAVEWRRKKDDWRRHFKEKMSQEEVHHRRKPWIRAWRKEKMSGGRRREGAWNFMPQKRSKLWSVILKWSKFKKCTQMTSIYSLSVTQNWKFKFHLNLWSQILEPKFH